MPGVRATGERVGFAKIIRHIYGRDVLTTMQFWGSAYYGIEQISRCFYVCMSVHVFLLAMYDRLVVFSEVVVRKSRHTSWVLLSLPRVLICVRREKYTYTFCGHADHDPNKACDDRGRTVELKSFLNDRAPRNKKFVGLPFSLLQ